MRRFIKENWFPVLLLLTVVVITTKESIAAYKTKKDADNNWKTFIENQPIDTVWRGWNKYEIVRSTDSGKLIWYGEQLIENTSYYLGPKGKVLQITNGMNCQNCHLSGGTLPFGNNYGKVYATYPQYRARNNGIQTIYNRVNDCLERSLNGEKLDSTTLEMRAIYAYIKWVGEEVPKGVAKGGTTLMKLAYLNRAADPDAGKQVYVANCESCHGTNGEGQMKLDDTGYTYPPLWGNHSYNDGAGLYRISNFASFAKNNMPFGTNYHNSKLTNEEAWDVAAFVNSQPRPHKDQTADWHNIEKKPIDFPFGPYVDTFTEKQHKYGPFKPIKDALELRTNIHNTK